MRRAVPVLALTTLLASCPLAASTPKASLSGQYFGQKPPGEVPKRFAPGIVSTRYHEHSSPAYSPEGREIFYTLSHEGGHRLMYMRMEDGRWSVPTTAPFSGAFSDDGAYFSVDGSRLHFRSRRPVPGLGQAENSLPGWVYRSWYVDRIDGHWPETATPNPDGDLGQTISGTRYVNVLGDRTDPYSNAICYQTARNGEYSDPTPLGDDVNAGELKYFGYVSPDESYLIFYAIRRPGQPENTMGLFITFRDSHGEWGPAIDFGAPINYPGGSTRFPRVSPDGQYLFFNWQKEDVDPDQPLTEVEASLQPHHPTVGGGDVYWVSANVIENLRAQGHRID